MLMLTHRVGDSLRISDNIVVTVLDVEHVKIGTDAPRDVHVVREELIDRELDRGGEA